MNLPVLPDVPDQPAAPTPAADDDGPTPKRPAAPWYAGGLDFTCTTCGNCCTGGPGYVWVTDEEIERAAGHLNMELREFRRRYTRRVTGKLSFKEVRRSNGLHDCVFLTELPAATEPEGVRRELEPGEAIPVGRRVCGIYPVRPLQCRTWPFWPENMQTKGAWNRAAKGCPGMNRGGRHFTAEQADAIRDANEWPAHPPTSAGGDVLP